jgi:hypothetical protein
MDPRHPEQAVSRLRELMKQYDRIEADIKKATIASQLGQLEREGGLVVQEICLVAPRIHEAMMQTSRQRRHDLSRGILIEPQDIAVETPQGGMFEPEIVEKPVEKSFHRADVVTEVEDSYKVEEPKPKKKTTRKKKTSKKADK